MCTRVFPDKLVTLVTTIKSSFERATLRDKNDNKSIHSISDLRYHGGDYEKYCLLGCDAM
jgi:hypothetical protein